MKEHEEKLSSIIKQIEGYRDVSMKYRELKQQYQLKAHELELHRTRISQTAHHQVVENVKELEVQLEEGTTLLDTLKQREVDAKKASAQLESEMQRPANTQNKEIQAKINATKKELQKLTKELKTKQQDVERVTLELSKSLHVEPSDSIRRASIRVEILGGASEECREYSSFSPKATRREVTRGG